MNNRKPLKASFLLNYLIRTFCLSFFIFSLISLNSANAKVITIGSSTDMIGIGTTTPESMLHIVPSTNMEGIIIKSSNFSPFIIKNSSNVEMFKIDQSGNITSSGSLVGSNNYWNLSGSSLYASNTSWNLGIGTTTPSGKLQVAGNTYIGSAAGGTANNLYLYGSTAGKIASLQTTSGNLHIDAATGSYSTYLNYYRGTGGVLFGNGATGSNARVTAAGEYIGYKLNINSKAYIDELGNVTGESFLDTSNVLYKLDPSNTNTSLNVAGSITSLGTAVTNYFAGSVGIGTTNTGTNKLEVVGNAYINGNLNAKSITNVKRAINSVSSNIGTPTVEEMALFHGQFNNKFRFIPPILQEESANGSTWTTSARATDNQLKDLMIGEGQGTSFNAIPSLSVGGSGYYRLTWDTSMTGYVYLNSLYIYNSTSGNQVNFKIDAYHNVNGWTEITNGTISNWPGHTYIPHSALPFHPTGTSHYSKVRVTFSITSATNTNPFALYAIEWFGGYPAATRNVQSYDRDKNVTFPAAIRGGGGTSGIPIFSFASDPDSGMYRGGDNIIRFSTGGSDRMTIYNNGRVGIGTTVPDTKLDVSGSINLSSSGKLAFGGVNTNWIDFTSNYFRLLMAGSSAAPIKVGGLVISGDYSPTAPSGGAYIQGNVGIGTTNPLDPLHVTGNVRVGGLLNCSGTGAAVKTDASGRLVCGTISGGVTGSVSGTTNYVTKWTGTNTLGNSVIYDNGTNVGIGTTTPAAKLQINPPTNVEGLRIISSSNYSPFVIRNSANTADFFRINQYGGVSINSGMSAANISVYPSANPYDSSAIGGLEIGKLGYYSPNDIGIVDNYNGNNLINYSYDFDKIFIGGVLVNDVYTGYVGIGTSDPGANLHIYGGAGSSKLLMIGEGEGNGKRSLSIGYNYNSDYSFLQSIHSQTAHTPLVLQLDGGSVGIGTTNPGTYKLAVNGTVNISSNTSIRGPVSFYSVASGETDRRLTFNLNSASTGIIYNYDEGAGTFHDIKIGGTSATNNGLFVSGAGNIGIGTVSPSTKLQINTTSAAQQDAMQLQGINSGSSIDTLIFRFNRDAISSVPANTWQIRSGGSSTRGIAFTLTDNNAPLLISSSGDIGMGSTNPSAKLDVISNSSTVIGKFTQLGTWNDTNYALSVSGYSYLNGFRINGDDGTRSLYAKNNRQLGLATEEAPITFTTQVSNERMRINANGNVGIGTTNPLAKLDVAGSSFFRTIDRIGPGSNNPVRGSWNPIWTAIAAGRALYADEEFASSTNSVYSYNNSVGTAVQLFWENGDGSQPNTSGKWIRIVHNGGATSPGYGGFYQLFNCRPNATFVQRFRAKLPTGYEFVLAENSLGDNKTSYWLTSTSGTGKWEEYIRVGHCGNSGTFSNGGHVYVSSSLSSSFTWYLASSNVYDVGSTPGVFSGNVSIGTTLTTYKLTVGGDVGATAFNYTSDRSLKKNIKTISNPVDKIMNLRGVSFNWKSDNKPSLGLIAQEVEKVFPELVTGDGLKSVQYGNLVAPLIEAVKEQQREIELLNKRIEALEARK